MAWDAERAGPEHGTERAARPLFKKRNTPSAGTKERNEIKNSAASEFFYGFHGFCTICIKQNPKLLVAKERVYNLNQNLPFLSSSVFGFLHLP